MATIRLTPAESLQTAVSPAKLTGGVVSSVTEQSFPGLGTIATVHGEVDDVLADMKEFYRAEPDQVMAAVSGHMARLVEMSILIGRIQITNRQWKPVGDEIDKMIAALREQFQVASRLITVRQLDQDLTRGSV